MGQLVRTVACACVAATLFSVSSLAAHGGPAETLTLANHYDASGTSPDGSSYKGKVTIDILSNTTFAIKWSIGNESYDGFGMRRNNALAATYMINGRPGLIIYEVQGNGLAGLWAVKGQEGSGTETLTPTE